MDRIQEILVYSEERYLDTDTGRRVAVGRHDAQRLVLMSDDMKYFAAEDILHIAIQPGPESGSVEISPNITAELNADGELIGVEILEASKYIRDGILESVQARLLQLKK